MKPVTDRRHGQCESAVLERPRYYPRQILTPSDMTLEQTYFRERLRRHNRYLHGWGVVCGAEVVIPTVKNSGDPKPWTITVKPGYVLGPCGDEIVIDCARTWNVRGGGPSGATGQPPVDYPDPWCSQVVQEPSGPVYIAVKYKEIPSRPVRVQPTGCGCDENQCVFSRWRDGYEFGVLTEPTDSHRSASGEAYGGAEDQETTGSAPGESAAECPECPPCPSDPWVVLAKVEFDVGGKVTSIDNCAYRRLVISFASKWETCESVAQTSDETEETTETEQAVPEDVVEYSEAPPSPESRSRRSGRRRRGQPEEPDTGHDHE